MINVRVIKKTMNDLPKEATVGSAGLDFQADLLEIKEKFLFNAEVLKDQEGNIKGILIMPGGRALIPTGIYMDMPEGIYMELFVRSGHAIKLGIMSSTGVSVIDTDYHQEIGIPLTNFGDKPFFIAQGDRIAQGVFKRKLDINFEVVEDFNIQEETRNGGYGSTNQIQ